MKTRDPAPRPHARRRQPMDARIRARRNSVLRERARRRRRITGSAAALVLAVVVAVGVARSPLFAIDEVRVVGAAGDGERSVLDAAGLQPGDNLLTADLAGAASRVSGLPWVRAAEARRRPPSAVELRVEPRAPVVVVHLPDARWLVDGEGIVVAGGGQDGLVELDAPNSVLPGVGGQVRDAALRNALTAHAQMPDSVQELIARYEARSARDLRLHLRGGVVVRFGVADDVAAKARSVTLLLEQAREQAERRAPGGTPDDALGVAEIDVRAPDNPVLVPAGG